MTCAQQARFAPRARAPVTMPIRRFRALGNEREPNRTLISALRNWNGRKKSLLAKAVASTQSGKFARFVFSRPANRQTVAKTISIVTSSDVIHMFVIHEKFGRDAHRPTSLPPMFPRRHNHPCEIGARAGLPLARAHDVARRPLPPGNGDRARAAPRARGRGTPEIHPHVSGGRETVGETFRGRPPPVRRGARTRTEVRLGNSHQRW